MADAVGREGNMSNLLALSTGSCKLVPYQTVQKTVLQASLDSFRFKNKMVGFQIT